MTFALNLKSDQLSTEESEKLRAMRKRCARRILLSTTLAASGHPGGSLSSLDLLLVTYGLIRHDPTRPLWEDRDRVVVSMGHISPGVYSVLAEYGYFSEEDFLVGFRRAGSGFPGHVERIVPGVEWDTGNLGQGLSAGVGMALALKLKGSNSKVIVFMGDGEQQKGQISEALRFAGKYSLNNLLVIIDRNHLQICGTTTCVMPQEIRATYAASGWNVLYLEDGHDYQAIHRAFADSYQGRMANPKAPTVIVARTIMSKGISFMEDQAKYHGSTLKREQLAAALAELGVENDFDRFANLRQQPVSTSTKINHRPAAPAIRSGEPVVYGAEIMTDCRSAYGKALLGLAQANNIAGAAPKVVGVSCDLEGSVKMGDFRKHSPEAFFEAGIQEHHAATMAGAMSREEMAVFFSTFGAFAVSEVYNQNRLNDINETGLKVVATHVGLDVGEDGPTHQCIDYLGLLRNFFRFSVFSPADPNQTDRITRYVASHAGNFFVGMGRSLTPVVTSEDGTPFFGADYEFTPGKADWLRRGDRGTILTYGALVPYALVAWRQLQEEGIAVGVLNMASLLPVDRQAIIDAAKTGPVLTVEDHHVDTGLGAMVGMVLAEEGIVTPFRRLGVSRYGASGKPEDLYADQGLHPEGIIKALKELLRGGSKGNRKAA
jgi:transketolase